MKKYKLIKKYPGSPEIGTIIEIREGTNMYFYGGLQIESPNKYPEFWEEVIEKDYRIIQMKNKRGSVYDLNEWEELCGYELEHHIIYSIKRLSDGEVLTINDNTNEGVIKEFQLCNDNRIIISFVDGLPRYLDATGSTHILKVIKSKFKSEDGVELNYGDDCYIVHKPLNNKTTNIQLNKSKFRKELPPNHSYRLIFSSKEAAENYIDLNKPAYSKAQLLLWLDNPKEAVKELLNK